MRPILSAILLAALLLFPQAGPAQDILPEPPADWGQLAEMMADLWEIEVSPNPSGGNAAVNALNLIGIGRASYEAVMGLEVVDDFPILGDGYDPDNWLPDQELTGQFMCKLKMVVWAAVFGGMVAYYPVPTSSGPDDPLTPEEEITAKEIAGQAVIDVVTLAQRDWACEPGGENFCYFCAGRNGPCWWGPCD